MNTFRMYKILFAVSVIMALAIGCSKKKKPDEIAPETTSTTTQDTDIQSKDINVDSQGSDSGKIQGLYSLHFEYDKATLNSESRALAQKDADWMKQHPDAKLQIEGHCDRHGSIEYNLALGERRAKAAKSYLMNLGVSGSRLTTISYGKERLLDTGENEAADAKNRRANFVLQGK